ncbi:hypothetical protein NXW50_13695 [Bacteroides thetaiotaomicron]|nr:hypothetical protein [Bacteroides thetaiotaomicron]MCS2279202.1 hypothetical protein [Bacteroides thetaiotaomicron]
MRKSVRSGGIERGAYRYGWGIANRLLSKKERELTRMVMLRLRPFRLPYPGGIRLRLGNGRFLPRAGLPG